MDVEIVVPGGRSGDGQSNKPNLGAQMWLVTELSLVSVWCPDSVGVRVKSCFSLWNEGTRNSGGNEWGHRRGA